VIREALNLSGRRTVPLIRQAEAAECGLASIAMIAAFHGHEVDLTTMRRRFGLSLKGITLRTIMEIAGALGFSSRPVRCELDEIRLLRLPAILHWGTNHFVVVTAVGRGRFVIHDPAFGRQLLTEAELSRQFTGIALELSPNAAFRRAKERNPLRLGTLLSFGNGVGRALKHTLVLSLVLELLILSGPFYLQFVIDEAIIKSDVGLLAVLAIAFTLLLLFRTAAGALRGLSTQYISNVSALDMKGRLFNHILRLPLDWFQKRQIGDIQSRFWAVRAIQDFVARGALAGILDGLLGTLILVFLFVYSRTLAAIVSGSIVIFVVLKFATFNAMKRYAADVIVTDAREQTRFLETLRAAQTIKSAAGEGLRETLYRNAMSASLNAQIRAGNINIAFTATQQLLVGATEVLVIYLGARAVMSAELTVGMLTAFLAYKSQFVARFTSLVEQLFAWRLLDLQLERLSDIALTPKEHVVEYGGRDKVVHGAVSCRRLSFRYAFGEEMILSSFDLEIGPGECVAIVGPSGCGKSTLAKLLTGLYTPTAGEVLVDGVPLSRWNTRVLRQQISYVSQDDQLLAGTIAENIASFAEEIQIELVQQCATLAQIHDEIMRMPMGYESLVGDMGSSLSGGQKQRVLIARALYRRPRILVLDEGTAHLDLRNEQAINDALSSLPITRIIVAHRPETIASANRIVRFGPAEPGPRSAPPPTPSMAAQEASNASSV
jgi:ATP-binding cassette subfamily B protein RaxB